MNYDIVLGFKIDAEAIINAFPGAQISIHQVDGKFGVVWDDSAGAVPAESDFLALQATWEDLHAWESEMADLDAAALKGLARTLEDYFDSNPAALSKKLQEYRDNHAERKIHRAKRPK